MSSVLSFLSTYLSTTLVFNSLSDSEEALFFSVVDSSTARRRGMSFRNINFHPGTNLNQQNASGFRLGKTLLFEKQDIFSQNQILFYAPGGAGWFLRNRRV